MKTYTILNVISLLFLVFMTSPIGQSNNIVTLLLAFSFVYFGFMACLSIMDEKE